MRPRLPYMDEVIAGLTGHPVGAALPVPAKILAMPCTSPIFGRIGEIESENLLSPTCCDVA